MTKLFKFEGLMKSRDHLPGPGTAKSMLVNIILFCMLNYSQPIIRD